MNSDKDHLLDQMIEVQLTPLIPLFTLCYKESIKGGYVGHIKEVKEVVSQGKTLEELKESSLKGLGLYLMYVYHNSKLTIKNEQKS